MEINAANCQSFQLEFYSSGDKKRKQPLHIMQQTAKIELC